MNIVPDTSVVIDGRVSDRIESGDFEGATVTVPEAVVAELEWQANEGYESGWEGLDELNRLADLATEGRIELEYVGDRPSMSAIDAADEGEIDAIIRDLAADMGATFVTSDVVQSEVARAKGLDVEYVAPRERAIDELSIAEYFDDRTMSVHLRSGVVPKAKRGAVGEMKYEAVGEDPLTEEVVSDYASEIENAARSSPDGFVELS